MRGRQSRVDQPAGAGLVETCNAHGYVYTLCAVYSKRFWGYVKQAGQDAVTTKITKVTKGINIPTERRAFLTRISMHVNFLS